MLESYLKIRNLFTKIATRKKSLNYGIHHLFQDTAWLGFILSQLNPSYTFTRFVSVSVSRKQV